MSLPDVRASIVKTILLVTLILVLAPALALILTLLLPEMPLEFKRACWVSSATAVYLVSIVAIYRNFLRKLTGDLKRRALLVYKIASLILGVAVAAMWLLLLFS